jgi:hypothetical protein
MWQLQEAVAAQASLLLLASAEKTYKQGNSKEGLKLQTIAALPGREA